MAESVLVSSTPITQQGEAGPSTLAARAASQEGPGKSKSSGKAVVKGKEKVKQEVNPELAALFEDDEIVAVPSPESTKKKKKKKKNKNKDKGTDDSAPKASMEPPSKTDLDQEKGNDKQKEKEKKRKRDSGLPTQTPSSGPSTLRTSPEKKARTTSPKKAVPATPKVIPPTPLVSVIHDTSPGPSRSAPSPTPPIYPRRAGQEPLFLDSAPSPHDTFGEPMPGFFDSRPGSTVASASATQSQSDSRSRAKMETTDLEESGTGPSGVDHDVEMEEESVNNALNIPESSETRSRSASIESPSIAPSASPTLVADATGTSTSLVAAALAAANGRSSAPNSQRPIASVTPTTVDKAKSKSPIPAAQLSQPSSKSSVQAAEPVVQPATRATRTPSAPPPPTLSTTATTAATVPIAPQVDPVPPTKPAKDDQPLAQLDQSKDEKAIEKDASTIVPTVEQQVELNDVLNKPPPTPSGALSAPAALASTTKAPISAVTGESDASMPTKPIASEVAPAARVSHSPVHSPPMEEPVPTFLSPRKISRSPSLPMDISSSPIIPAEELPNPEPDQGISPPRYILNSPVKQSNPLPVKPPSPIKIKMPISERPKYVQPSRIQFLSDIVDPEAAARQAKKAGKNLPPPPPSLPPPPPPPHAHPTLPDRPRPPAIHPSRLPLVDTGSRKPIHAPVQPRGFGATPSGPSGYGPRQSGPLADQKDSYRSKPPWEKRKDSADPLGGQSSMR